MTPYRLGFLTLKIEALPLFETSGTFNQTTRVNFPADVNLQEETRSDLAVTYTKQQQHIADT